MIADRYLSSAVLAGIVLAPALVQAQAPTLDKLVPAKTVQIIVPNAPGGGLDFVARLIAPKLSETLRQNVIVDNRASANGIVGTEMAAKGAADGSVIAVGNGGTHAINATLYRKLPYDPVRDFAAVSEIVATPLVVVVHPAVPAKSIKELIALGRKHPGKLNFAVSGATGELAGNALKLQGGFDMKNIPFKGAGPATISVISGETDLIMTNYLAVASQVDAGKLRLLGVTSARRSALLSKIPTVAEAGLEGYDHQLWYGMFLPSKTPAPVVQALYREVARIVALPDVRERFVTTGHEIVVSTPEQFSDKVRREVEKFRKIIIDSKMPIE